MHYIQVALAFFENRNVECLKDSASNLRVGVLITTRNCSKGVATRANQASLLLERCFVEINDQAILKANPLKSAAMHPQVAVDGVRPRATCWGFSARACRAVAFTYEKDETIVKFFGNCFSTAGSSPNPSLCCSQAYICEIDGFY